VLGTNRLKKRVLPLQEHYFLHLLHEIQQPCTSSCLGSGTFDVIVRLGHFHVVIGRTVHIHERMHASQEVGYWHYVVSTIKYNDNDKEDSSLQGPHRGGILPRDICALLSAVSLVIVAP
jgi:hypothetical protein